MPSVTIFNVIFPVFAIALAGYLLARLGVLRPPDVTGLAAYVFNIAAPVLLFHSLARLEIPAEINWGYLLAYYLAAFAVYGLGMLVSRWRFRHSRPEQGVFGMAAAYSNTLLIGLPVVVGAFGDEALLPILLIISPHAMLLSLTVVTIAESGAGDGRQRRQALQNTARRMLVNPIILGVAAGLVFNRLGLTLPGVLAETTELVGQSLLPCALIMLGASLTQYRLREYSQEAWVLVALKLLAQPLLVGLLLTFVFPVSPLWTAVAILTAGLPIGITVTTFAYRYQACIPSVAAATLLSTVLALGSLTVMLYFLV
jgi:malonate transporter